MFLRIGLADLSESTKKCLMVVCVCERYLCLQDLKYDSKANISLPTHEHKSLSMLVFFTVFIRMSAFLSYFQYSCQQIKPENDLFGQSLALQLSDNIVGIYMYWRCSIIYSISWLIEGISLLPSLPFNIMGQTS